MVDFNVFGTEDTVSVKLVYGDSAKSGVISCDGVSSMLNIHNLSRL